MVVNVSGVDLLKALKVKLSATNCGSYLNTENSFEVSSFLFSICCFPSSSIQLVSFPDLLTITHFSLITRTFSLTLPYSLASESLSG